MIALFGAAGSQFIFAHVAEQKRLRIENASLPPAARWRRFRFPHLLAEAAKRPPLYYKRVVLGFGYLMAGFLILAFLLPSL